jgi:hypothetical protein
MWARVAEILLSFWLVIGHFLFRAETNADLIIAFLVFLFAVLSYKETLNKMHLLQVIPAFWLLWISFSYPTPFLPFGLQNHILVALTLLMFAVIPSHASEHPRPWKKFLRSRNF